MPLRTFRSVVSVLTDVSLGTKNTFFSFTKLPTGRPGRKNAGRLDDGHIGLPSLSKAGFHNTWL